LVLRQGVKLLNGWKRPGRFDKGLGAQLPEAYRKFWREWKLTTPAAVHYIPKEREWERDEAADMETMDGALLGSWAGTPGGGAT